MLEVAIWWAVLILAYAATLPVATGPELVGAVVAAGVCAVLAVAARRAAGSVWRPTATILRRSVLLPVAIAADTVRLLGRGGHGSVRTVEQAGGEPPPRASWRRSWGTLVLSASPGSVVLDWPDDGSPVVLHELGSGRPRLDGVANR